MISIQEAQKRFAGLNKIKVMGGNVKPGTRVHVTADLNKYASVIDGDKEDENYLWVRFDLLFGTTNYLMRVWHTFVWTVN